MMDRILLIMPTRGRPWAALEAIASVMKNASHPQMVTVRVGQDRDDAHRFHLDCAGVESWSQDRMLFVEWVNYMLLETGAWSWIGWLGDDVRYLTPGWDTLVRSHKELVVYGDDGNHGEKMATHPFIRTEIPRALGYLAPPALVHLCADTFIEALARELGSIAYDPRIKTEHLHPDYGKGKMDQTYLDAKAHWANDINTFETVIRPQIPGLADKVREFIKQPV